MSKKDAYIINGVDLSEVRNRNEILVIAAMKEVIEPNSHVDGCSLCIEDLYALILSRIPACYAQKGSVILHPEISKAEILEIVQNAVTLITQNPKHD